MDSRIRPISRLAVNRRSLILGGLAAGLLTTPVGAGDLASKLPVTPPAAPPLLAADPAIAALVSQVSQERLRSHVETLSAFPTRWTESPDFERVAAWVADAFGDPARGGGAAPGTVARQGYTLPSGLGRDNIVVGNPRDPRGVILLGAHMDSISERPSASAPGANDNATGIAVLIEVHRLLSGLSRDKEVVLVAFSGEEQDLLGSTACAAIARAEAWPIEVMINLDMLGYRPSDPGAPIVIEYDQGNALAENDAPARRFGLLAAQLAASHATLAVTHTDIWDSDYMPFEAAGFACIGLYDNGADSAEYHTSADTADRVDYARLEQVARIVVATVATLAQVRA